jgi:predicted branched-subunit amino acid permease
MNESGRPEESVGLSTILPVAVAIGVFGMVYGAAAQPLFGSVLTLTSSLIIFSGTVQFTMVGLAAVGTGPVAILWAVFVVNVRNLALGGAIRPHLASKGAKRLLLSWFLIDETVGLSLASPGQADRILLRAGIWSYGGWVLGTAIGVAGGASLGLEGLASVVFPVLFIGLAALMVRTRGALYRALAGAAVTLGLLLAWPGLAGLAPVIGGLVAAIPGRRAG